MTHFSAETLEVVSDEVLADRYDSYLDESGEFNICVDGNELIPSEVLKSVDPIAYEQSLNDYINSRYDAGELMTEWDRDDHIKEQLYNDWAFTVLGEILDHTTKEEDQTIYNTLFKLYERGILELDTGEIILSSQHTMAEVLISLGEALNENENK